MPGAICCNLGSAFSSVERQHRANHVLLLYFAVNQGYRGFASRQKIVLKWPPPGRASGRTHAAVLFCSSRVQVPNLACARTYQQVSKFSRKGRHEERDVKSTIPLPTSISNSRFCYESCFFFQIPRSSWRQNKFGSAQTTLGPTAQALEEFADSSVGHTDRPLCPTPTSTRLSVSTERCSKRASK